MTRFSRTKIILVILLCIAFIGSSYTTKKESYEGIEILQKVFNTNKSIHSISLTMNMKERIDGELVQKKTDFKVCFRPYKVYMKQSYPYQGLELLYVEGQNNGKLLVNRNTRTFSNFKFDPLNNTVRKGNHHSILKAGYGFLLEVLEHIWVKYNKDDDLWKYEGLVSYGGINCYKVSMNNPDFNYFKYTICQGDNLESLSRKFKVCDYLIFEKNPQIKSFDELKAGTVILIPSDYAKQIIIYIDKTLLLPIAVKAFDDKGLFEEYLYSNIKINPDFKPLDFDSKNSSYGFRQ
jgi:outer membrane lipoprotein-sorting protein